MSEKNLVKKRADEYIAKIEGHGSLAIDWRKGKVELNVHEGERLFEGILVGRTADEMHWITPRICGVCPIAHNLASLAATEDALGVEITETAKLLRRLMQVGQNVQSHVLHAVFLALPDYIGIDRITELDFKDPKKFELALSLKELGDEIAYVVAGRNVHPTRTTVGGFHKTPTKEELSGLLEKVKIAIPKAKALADFFATLEYPELQVDLELLAQKDGKVLSNKRESFSIKDYKKNIEEEVKKYSTAKFGSYKGNVYMVGSLARLYHKSFYDRDISFFGLDFKNPYHNNLAQVIETLFELEEAVSILGKLLKKDIDDRVASPSKNPSLVGIGAVEAPRGGLYNEVHFDKDGIIKYANIITPTVQNLTSMENTAEALLAQHSEKSHEELEHLMEMLIRAYDPCITCSVH
ncbi:MAG: Ni/Fe hydrogenase subunit alpha [Parcubacteria group bacterium]|nr:Ni/Fe hydrogenase subunit alpha [Parcubacteria group bacterium]MCR4342943.1 Ni/Fe hydrogenase subunit alpha [Patescibacteria group bacterium]